MVGCQGGLHTEVGGAAAACSSTLQVGSPELPSVPSTALGLAEADSTDLLAPCPSPPALALGPWLRVGEMSSQWVTEVQQAHPHLLGEGLSEDCSLH